MSVLLVGDGLPTDCRTALSVTHIKYATDIDCNRTLAYPTYLCACRIHVVSVPTVLARIQAPVLIRLTDAQHLLVGWLVGWSAG